MSALLPHVPEDVRPSQGGTIPHLPPTQPLPTVSDLVHRFLVYSQSQRLPAEEALKHPWLIASPLLVPADLHSLFSADTASELDGMKLEDHLQVFLGTRI